MHVFIHVFLLTRMHEDMLFYKGGVCDTFENSGISGELVILVNKVSLTYLDLYNFVRPYQ